MLSTKELNTMKDDLRTLLYDVGEIIKKGFNDSHKTITSKTSPNDLLTQYDIEVNEAIIKHLEEKYPEISIISEEAEEILKQSDYAFVADPIDGTRNFVRGIPVFFTGIGLIKQGETILSITYNPAQDQLFHAIKGQGAFLNNKPIKVSERTLELADVCVRTLPNKKLEKHITTNIIEHAHQIKNNMCSHDEISGVASDKYDGFISKNSSPRDYCHYLLVEEAGGKVTDRKGEKFDISKDSIILSNGIIHDKLVEITGGGN